MTEDPNTHPDGNKTPIVQPGNYSPVTVTMTEVIGVVFLGVLSMVFLISWRRAEARYRALVNDLLDRGY